MVRDLWAFRGGSTDSCWPNSTCTLIGTVFFSYLVFHLRIFIIPIELILLIPSYFDLIAGLTCTIIWSSIVISIYLPSIGWLCGVGVFSLIECLTHSYLHKGCPNNSGKFKFYIIFLFRKYQNIDLLIKYTRGNYVWNNTSGKCSPRLCWDTCFLLTKFSIMVVITVTGFQRYID